MNPKHYSQIERAIQCFNKSSTADFLKDNHYLFFIFKKTERFVAALYILTELFSDAEPIKWELRTSGTSIGKDILSFREKNVILSKENIGDIFGTIVRIASLLEIAHIANLISAMNLGLFRKELDVLASFIESRGRMGKGIGEDTPFHEDFFRVSSNMPEMKHPDTASPVLKTPRADVPHTRLFRSQESSTLFLHKVEQLPGSAVDRNHKGHGDIKDSVLCETDGIGKGHDKVRRMGGERRQTILDVLRVRNVAVIKDFTVVIGGCSGKTVQRELLKMVQEGILRKEGERRWSRYSLA